MLTFWPERMNINYCIYCKLRYLRYEKMTGKQSTNRLYVISRKMLHDMKERVILFSFILHRNKDLNRKRPYFILATQTTDPWSWHRFQEQVRLACCCFEAKLRVFRGTKSEIERYKMFLWLLVYGQRRNFLKNVGVVIKFSCSFYPCNAHTRNAKFLKSLGCTYTLNLHPCLWSKTFWGLDLDKWI